MTAQTILPANTLSGGYNVANSLRFNDGDSAYLNFTPSSDGSRRIFTISFWFKQTNSGATRALFSTGNYSGGDGFLQINLSSSGRLTVDDYDQSGNSYNLRWTTPSTFLFKDPGAWYHFVLAVDSTQGTQSNRAKVYINGVDISSDFTQTTSTAQNDDFHVNTSSQLQQIGRSQNNNNYYDGYLAEFVMIDGSALAPTSFGEFDEDSGIWKPIDVSGLTFGTNGFYLEFKESGTSQNSSGLGADTSGNDHHYAVNNLAAGDQSTDTCTNNFCTLNPLINLEGSYTLSEGNTEFLGTGGNDGTFGTLSVQGAGKWYFEAEFDTNPAVCYAGFADVELANNEGTGNAISSFIGMYRDDYTMQIGGSSEGAYTNVSAGDIFGFAMNLDADSGSRTVIIQKNGSTIDTVTIPTANENNAFIPVVGDTSDSDGKLKMNFGGTPNPTPSSAVSDANGFGAFEYDPTIGGVAYLALCTKNLGSNG